MPKTKIITATSGGTGDNPVISDRFDRLANRIKTQEQTCDHRSGTMIAAIVVGGFLAVAQFAFDLAMVLR